MGASEDLRQSRIPRENLQQLLERVALLVRPGGEGGATLLFTLGRIATSERWLESGFSVEITGDDEASVVEIFSEDGSRASSVSPTTFAVPLREIIGVLDADPDVIGSLRASVDARKIVLTTTRSSGAVPAR